MPFFYRPDMNSKLNIKKLNSKIINDFVKEKQEDLLNEIDFKDFLYLVSTQFRRKNYYKNVAYYTNDNYYNYFSNYIQRFQNNDQNIIFQSVFQKD
jgi:lipid A disaccharide synthetase